MSEMLTLSKAAEFVGLHANTLRRYTRNGRIASLRDYRNYRLFNVDDLKRLRDEKNELKAEAQNR